MLCSDIQSKDTKTELAALEKQCLENNAKHKNWTCTEELMKLTKDGKAHYMHWYVMMIIVYLIMQPTSWYYWSFMCRWWGPELSLR